MRLCSGGVAVRSFGPSVVFGPLHLSEGGILSMGAVSVAATIHNPLIIWGFFGEEGMNVLQHCDVFAWVSC